MHQRRLVAEIGVRGDERRRRRLRAAQLREHQPRDSCRARARARRACPARRCAPSSITRIRSALHDRAQPMRDDDARAAQLVERADARAARSRRRARWSPRREAGSRALRTSARASASRCRWPPEIEAPRSSEQRVVAERHGHDVVVNVGELGGVDDRRSSGERRIGERDVGADGGAEEVVAAA